MDKNDIENTIRSDRLRVDFDSFTPFGKQLVAEYDALLGKLKELETEQNNVAGLKKDASDLSRHIDALNENINAKIIQSQDVVKSLALDAKQLTVIHDSLTQSNFAKALEELRSAAAKLRDQIQYLDKLPGEVERKKKQSEDNEQAIGDKEKKLQEYKTQLQKRRERQEFLGPLLEQAKNLERRMDETMATIWQNAQEDEFDQMFPPRASE